MVDSIPVGKVPIGLLKELWKRHPPQDPRVIVGPGIGLDSAVLDWGDRYLVAKTDPITFATDRIGWYAVHINANDVACSGAVPRWFMATLLLPAEGSDAQLVKTIYGQIAEACQSIGVSLVGGHSEVTYGIDRPIVVGTLLGEVAKERLITTSGTRPGDLVLLTGGIPIEAVAIIARERSEQVAQVFDPEFMQRARNFIFDPGISVMEDAHRAQQAGQVHAFHDPTEGGLATGLWELAEASNCTLEVDMESIPILPEGEALCRAFNLNPLGAIASGALLMAVPEHSAEPILEAFKDSQRLCQIIGRVGRIGEGAVRIRVEGKWQPLEFPDRDEIAKIFE